MRRVVICSPWRGDTEKHSRYLDACLRDSYARGEAPIAPHAIGPRVLDEDDPAQRQQGIAAGLAWMAVADALIVCVDLGVSPGMKAEIKSAQECGVEIRIRWLDEWKEEKAA